MPKGRHQRDRESGRRGPSSSSRSSRLSTLPARVAGERLVAEPDVGRDHEAGQASRTCVESSSAPTLAPGGARRPRRPLRPASGRVRRSRRSRPRPGVRRGRLRPDRVDVLPAADDHVLGPVDDVDEVVGVEPGDVAGVEPALVKTSPSPRAVPVAPHDVGSLDPQLARARPGPRGWCRRAPRRRSPRARRPRRDTGTGGPDAVGLGDVVAARCSWR